MSVNVNKYPDISYSRVDNIKEGQLSEVIKALKESPNLGKLDVREIIGLPQSISKFDTVTFDNESILILEAIDDKFIAIAIKELIFDIKNPKYKASISRPIGKFEDDILLKLKGVDGANGLNGHKGANGGGNGSPGGNGTNGSDGMNGQTKQIPPVYIFVQSIKFGTAGTPDKQFFNLYFPGFDGGNGGKGGDGGAGGRGGDGQNSVSGMFDCKSGAGRGGDGGNGGAGGRGGNGGNGGNGASIYLFAPDSSIFNFTTGNIEAGVAGVLGHGGNAGAPGKGGSGGAATGLCSGSGRNGFSGLIPNPQTLGDGKNGGNGLRGIQIVKSRDNSDLF